VIEPTEGELVAEADLLAGAERAAAPESPAPPDTPLGRNRDFQVFLFGQGLSGFGDAITFTALPILVLALTGSGLAMGIVGVLETLPDLLLGLPAGAFADRLDRRKMMLLADLGRALLTALIPISVALTGPTMGVILLVAFPLNCLRVLWLAGYTASVPGLVGRSQVGRATSILEAVFNLGFIAGPGIAGVLAAVIGPGPTIAIDALSFAISAGALLLIRRPLKPPPRTEDSHFLAEIREGVAYVVGHPVLRSVILLWSLVAVGTGALVTALTFHFQVDRLLGTEVLGFVLSAYGLGSLAGAVLATRLAGGALGRNMLLGTFAMGLTLLVVAASPPVPLVLAASFTAGVAQSNVLIAYLTLRTTHSPNALLGRVGSTARVVSIGLTPLGLLAGGLLIDATDGATALAAMGFWMVVLALGFGASAIVRGARAPSVQPSP
jgi:MFS transporter, ENTS family, enterobactin (siderophore) exporter